MEPWNLGSRLHILGSMVPWFHPKIPCQKSKNLLGGTMEPWNLGSRLHILGSMVPWFHLKIQCQKSKILLGGTMEPWNQGSRLHKKVPWFHGSTQIFLGWNCGTMEPWFQATHLRFHGSMVPWFRGGTMEPWNHGTQMCIMSISREEFIFIIAASRDARVSCRIIYKATVK